MDLKEPCQSCPFRTNIRPYLRLDRMLGIIRYITIRDGSFPCHKTTGDSDDGAERDITEHTQHCAGAMIYLVKNGRMNQWMRIAMRLGIFNPEKLKLKSKVFRGTAQVRTKFREHQA